MLKRIRIDTLADPEQIRGAKELAAKRSIGSLPDLKFTESDYRFVLLYNHIRVGQLTPKVFKQLKREYLYYIAGHTAPHPELSRPEDAPKQGAAGTVYETGASKRWEEQTKLQGNAYRALEEIKRRNRYWSGVLIIIGATLAAFIGAYAGTVANNL